jgi:hypothetical protein
MPQHKSSPKQPDSFYHWLGRDAVGLYWIEDGYGGEWVPVASLSPYSFNHIEVTTVSDTARQFIDAFPAA